MTWWLWTLLWIALVIGALAVLFQVARSLFRKGVALAHELGDAAERLSAVAQELEALGGRDEPAQEPAVFDSPTRLRAARIAGRRGAGRSRKGR